MNRSFIVSAKASVPVPFLLEQEDRGKELSGMEYDQIWGKPNAKAADQAAREVL